MWNVQNGVSLILFDFGVTFWLVLLSSWSVWCSDTKRAATARCSAARCLQCLMFRQVNSMHFWPVFANPLKIFLRGWRGRIGDGECVAFRATSPSEMSPCVPAAKTGRQPAMGAPVSAFHAVALTTPSIFSYARPSSLGPFLSLTTLFNLSFSH